jgi:hypothetical protein
MCTMCGLRQAIERGMTVAKRVAVPAERAKAARHYVAERWAERVGHGATLGDDELDVAMVDMLADLQHLADQAGLEWTELLRVANDHWEAEVAEHQEAERQAKLGAGKR